MIQLDFGCGNNLKKGFIGIDNRPLKDVSFCCNAWQADQYFAENSVDEIYSCHLFQYLTYAQAFQTLKVWHTLLKLEAVCQIIVPDFHFYCEQYLSLSCESDQEMTGELLEANLKGIWGSQNIINERIDVHQSGFDFKLLCAMLLKNNFKTIFRLNDTQKPYELNIMAQKVS
jgi:predicted SAM-dependent methyltransferase